MNQNFNFNEGDKLRFIRVRFPGNAQSFPFYIGEKQYRYGQKVVAMSDRGVDVGYISSFSYELRYHKDIDPIHTIKKLATEKDVEQQKEFYQQRNAAENFCKKTITHLRLEMDLTHVEVLQFGKKIVFYFTAAKRVDFRELVKQLAQELRVKIELRQIGVRDRSAAVGGIGPCGRELCCSSFLEEYGQVGIKMAKNQNLSLNYNSLNGVCGQVKCCVRYENAVYTQKRKTLPKEQSLVQTRSGHRGKILKLNPLPQEFEMLCDDGHIRRFLYTEYDPDILLPQDWNFPKKLEHVVRDTEELIGEAPEKVQDNAVELKKDAERFADEVLKSFHQEKAEA